MTTLEDFISKHDCLELLQRAKYAVDGGDLDTFVDCFAPDGIWKRPGVDPIVGRQAIRALLAEAPTGRVTRHMSGGAWVDLVSVTTAVGHSQTALYTGTYVDALPAPVSPVEKIFDYTDALVRTDEGWKIQERVTTMIFQKSA